MLPFSRADLERLYHPATWKRGETLQEQGTVVELDVERDGKTISGKVKEADRRVPYLVRIQVQNGRGGRVKVSSTCTCMIHTQCEHAVAMLLHALHKTAAPEPEEQTVAIDSETEAWLAAMSGTNRASDSDNDVVLYLLEPAQRSWRDLGVAQPVSVRTSRARRLRDGMYGRDNSVSISQIASDDAPRFVTLEDQVIGRLLAGVPGNVRRLAGPTDGEVLRMMLATGHCHWQSSTNPALTLGEDRPGKVVWRFNGEGQQRALCELDGADDDTIILNLGQPWYADLKNGVVGKVETGLDVRPLRHLLNAPAIPAITAGLVRQKLVAAVPDIPLPEPLKKRERIEVAPTPVLHLHCPRVQVQRGLGWNKEIEDVDLPLLRLSFDYAGAQVGWQDGKTEINHVSDNRLLVIPRDALLEVPYVERLNALGLQPLGPTGLGKFADPSCRQDFTFEEGEEDDDLSFRWVQFNHQELPRLVREGWKVTFGPEYPYRVAKVTNGWHLDVVESGIDWFEAKVEIDVDGERLPLLPVILELFERAPESMSPSALEEAGEEPIYANLPDGRILPIPAERLAAILRSLYELLAAGKVDESGTLKLSRAEATRLIQLEDELPKNTLVWNGGESIRQLARQLTANGELPKCMPPRQLKADLRPYQKQGLDWLQFLHHANISGVLADDMGLGKTLQTLAHIALLKEQGKLDKPVLIVGPTSLIPTWRSEVRKFVPHIRLLVLHGQDRHDLFEHIQDYDVVLTSYALLLRDSDELLARDWRLVVLDEAQAIKNPTTKLARTAYKIKADQRLCLTGTPIENHLGELWSMFNFLMPGYLGDRENFRKVFRTQIEKDGNQERQQLLAARVRPFMIRRTKDQVAQDLPEKNEIMREIELTDTQRDLYETVRLAMHARVRQEIAERGLAQSNIAILEALLKLRQVCCDPRLLKSDKVDGFGLSQSAKLDLLSSMLPDMIENGRRIIIFSQFVEMLDLIEKMLTEIDIDFVKLTGRTKDRETPVKRFQAGEVPIFLISLKAGGTGLTLTRADTVIHYDPWWNPAVEAQATDRAHRIGQDKTVFVYKLISSGTVEEKMIELQQKKKQLVDGILTGTAGSMSFSEQDIDQLFAPLEA